MIVRVARCLALENTIGNNIDDFCMLRDRQLALIEELAAKHGNIVNTVNYGDVLGNNIIETCNNIIREYWRKYYA